MALSEKANNVNWLMANFVRSTPGVEQAIAVSSDGLLIALSSQLERASADKMAAIITGMRALAHGAANELAKGQVMQVLVEMAERLPVRQRHLRRLDARRGHRSRLRPGPRRLRDHPARRTRRRTAHPDADHRAEELVGRGVTWSRPGRGRRARARLVRPFLDRKRPLAVPPERPIRRRLGSGVRAYAMTGGRAHAVGAPRVRDHAAGHRLLAVRRSTRAEVRTRRHPPPVPDASRCRLPSSRPGCGCRSAWCAWSRPTWWPKECCEAFQPSANVADDVLLITRLIAGVRAL